jgi:hypothetical protein
MGDAIGVWNAASEVLRGQLSDSVWMSTFAEVVPLEAAGGFVLAVPNRWTKDRIEERHLDAVRAALSDVGVADTDVVVEVRPEPPSTPNRSTPSAPRRVINRTSTWRSISSRPPRRRRAPRTRAPVWRR